MNALDACPFCGGRAIRIKVTQVQEEHRGGVRFISSAKCMECGAEVFAHDAHSLVATRARSNQEAQLNAIAVWNTRR